MAMAQGHEQQLREDLEARLAALGGEGVHAPLTRSSPVLRQGVLWTGLAVACWVALQCWIGVA